MKIYLKVITLILVVLSFASCKKNRTCKCTLTYFSKPEEIRNIDAGKVRIKEGQDKCNTHSSDIVNNETKNGLSGVKCEIQ